MAVSAFVRQATMAAVREFAANPNLSATTRSFWGKYNFPAMDVRNDILGRAEAIMLGREEFPNAPPDSLLKDIFSGTGYCPDTEDCGPFDSPEATIFGKAMFKRTNGSKEYKSFRVKVGWDATMAEVNAAIKDEIKALGRKYGRKGGEATDDLFTIG